MTILTKDEIIRMARGAGFAHSWSEAAGHALERFASLVAAAEREACAKVCEEELCNCCWEDDAQDAAEHLAETIRARGR